MTTGQLLDFLVNLKHAGNNLGFSDQELGKLEIIRVQNGMKVEKNFTLELAKIEGSGFCVLLKDEEESKNPFKISTLKIT